MKNIPVHHPWVSTYFYPSPGDGRFIYFFGAFLSRPDKPQSYFHRALDMLYDQARRKTLTDMLDHLYQTRGGEAGFLYWFSSRESKPHRQEIFCYAVICSMFLFTDVHHGLPRSWQRSDALPLGRLIITEAHFHHIAHFIPTRAPWLPLLLTLLDETVWPPLMPRASDCGLSETPCIHVDEIETYCTRRQQDGITGDALPVHRHDIDEINTLARLSKIEQWHPDWRPVALYDQLDLELYRKMIRKARLQTHPDKGGNATDFHLLQETRAYLDRMRTFPMLYPEELAQRRQCRIYLDGPKLYFGMINLTGRDPLGWWSFWSFRARRIENYLREQIDIRNAQTAVKRAQRRLARLAALRERPAETPQSVGTNEAHVTPASAPSLAETAVEALTPVPTASVGTTHHNNQGVTLPTEAVITAKLYPAIQRHYRRIITDYNRHEIDIAYRTFRGWQPDADNTAVQRLLRLNLTQEQKAAIFDEVLSELLVDPGDRQRLSATYIDLMTQLIEKLRQGKLTTTSTYLDIGGERASATPLGPLDFVVFYQPCQLHVVMLTPPPSSIVESVCSLFFCASPKTTQTSSSGSVPSQWSLGWSLSS